MMYQAEPVQRGGQTFAIAHSLSALKVEHCKARLDLTPCFGWAQVKATVQNGNTMHAADMLCSISFDRDDEYFATAGVSRRIKVAHALLLLGGFLVPCLEGCEIYYLVRMRSTLLWHSALCSDSDCLMISSCWRGAYSDASVCL